MAAISTPFIDAYFFVTRFGAAEIASVLNRRLSTRLSGDDLLAQVDDDPGTVPGDPAGAAAAEGWINDYIEDAHGKVVGAIQAQYGENFTDIDPSSLVRRIEADLARYYLYEDHPTEVVIRRYEDASSELEEIARGRLKLGVGVTSGDKIGVRRHAVIVEQPTDADVDGQSISDDDYSLFTG